MYISTPPSPEVQIKIYYSAGDRTLDLLNQGRTCYQLSQRGEHCANCLKQHSANFKECPKYINYIQGIERNRSKRLTNNFTPNSNDFSNLPSRLGLPVNNSNTQHNSESNSLFNDIKEFIEYLKNIKVYMNQLKNAPIGAQKRLICLKQKDWSKRWVPVTWKRCPDHLSRQFLTTVSTFPYSSKNSSSEHIHALSKWLTITNSLTHIDKHTHSPTYTYSHTLSLTHTGICIRKREHVRLRNF